MTEIVLTLDNFESEVLSSEKTVLVDFWATWCMPCRMIAPIIEEIAKERDDIKVGKINVDEQPALAAKFGIASIPTIMVFKEGKQTGSIVGYRPKEDIEKLL